MSDWREAVLDTYREARASRGFNDSVFRRDMNPLQFSCTRKFVAYLSAAALSREINRSTYARRVLAVAIAHDLGIDVREVLWHTPVPRPPGPQKIVGEKSGERDLGEGIEHWCPHPGCDGSHLQP